MKVVFPGSPTSRINFGLFLVYIFYFMILTHLIVAVWLWMGDKYLLGDQGDPWRIKTPIFHTYNRYQLYIFAYYWVCTIISTTGYGDYTGGTQVEYLFTIFIEFTGVIVFVVLMYLVNNIIQTNSSFDAFFQDKIAQFDIWFTLVEKCKQPKHMSPDLYYTMYQNISVSMYSDFNIIIEEYQFFEMISPKLQTKLIKLMFSDFISNFKKFFVKMEQNFINQIVVNLHARVF